MKWIRVLVIVVFAAQSLVASPRREQAISPQLNDITNPTELVQNNLSITKDSNINFNTKSTIIETESSSSTHRDDGSENQILDAKSINDMIIEKTAAPLNMSIEDALQSHPELFFTQHADEFVDIINNLILEKNTAYSIAGTAVADTCNTLIDRDQILGLLGKSVYNQFIQNAGLYTHLLDGGALKKDCTKYSQMRDVKQKALVWVLILTVMAHFESSCRAGANTKGPNGTAYGYYQLHLGQEDKYDGASNECVKYASKDPAQSSKCVLKMLDMQLERDNGVLFSNKSYWDVLRPKGAAQRADDIERAIQKSSYCNPKTM